MLLLFVIATWWLHRHAASQVAPTGTIVSITSLISLRDPATVNDGDNCNMRSIWNILWSCLTTIFACTWVAVHPNIPGPEDSDWKVLSRRLKLMVRVILMPETVVYWAWRQFYAAKKVADRYNSEEMRTSREAMATTDALAPRWKSAHQEERWTRTHGFFAVMGGFMLCRSDGKPLRCLPPNALFEHAKQGDLRWPNITEKEIWDRSKGDYLAKGIVVLQTTWFIATCIARATQRLPVTELEIVTHAFASLSGLMYLFWWQKPLDIRCPIQVYLKPNCQGRLLKDFTVAHHAIPDRGLLAALFKFMYKAFVSPVNSGHVSYNAKRAMTFFALETHQEREEERNRGYALFVVSVGSLFGGIHSAAWSFHFPTEVEKWIWRTSSLALLGSPILICASVLALERVDHRLGARSLHSAVNAALVETLFVLWIIILSVAYLFARISLLVLPFVAFRSLPPGALNDVEWTSFIPHIG